MLLYTIIPPEYIFAEEDDYGQYSSKIEEIEIQKNGKSFLVSPTNGGRAKINRIISTNPQDYLNPEWQPGSIMAVN